MHRNGARVETRKAQKAKRAEVPDVQATPLRRMKIPPHIAALAEKLRKATPTQ